MKAFQLTHHGQPGRFALRDLADLQPGPEEVCLEVGACGLNHLDLWLEENALPIPISLPRTPGSEIAGRVLQAGSAAGNWTPGQRVAVQSNLFCGRCEFCQAGQESLCVSGRLLGVDRDGGFAEQVLVPARSLVALPDPLGFEEAAALSLAASTAMHMLTERASVKENDWVLVVGASSGVGSAAIQIARELGARVIATGSSEEKRALGRKLGAKAVVDSTDPKWPGAVREISGRRGVDLVVEHVGGPVLAQVFQCLARGGTIVTCGATAGREVLLNLWPFFVKEQKLVGSYGRNRRDLQKTLDWAARGTIRPVIDCVLPLSETASAFARLRARNVFGKIVICPGSPALGKTKG